MINASLTGPRSKRISRQTNGLFGRLVERNDNNQARQAHDLRARFPDLKRDMDKVDCVVIGAGVIGLAVARRLAQAGREVIVLEAAEGIGTVTSSRNSEVIHAGIYYRAGSLMAQMCVSGKHALYRLLPRPRHPASQLRQADRRDDTAGNRKTAIDPRACRSQRRRRSCNCSRAKPPARWSRR